MALPECLRRVPWATLGRRESFAELDSKWAQQKESVGFFKARPLISLVILKGIRASALDTQATLESIRAQSYPHWEIIDESKVHEARGEWVGFIENGDLLSPVALYFCVLEIVARPEAKGFYTNEIRLAKGGERIAAYFSKPRFSRFTLQHFNYCGRFFLYRRELSPPSGKVEYAHLLDLSENSNEFHLVPYFLYYRRGLLPIETGPIQRVSPRLLRRPKVSAIVCFKDKADWTIECLKAIAEHAGKIDLEVILVNNASSPSELERVRAAASASTVPAKVVDYARKFNFGDMHNWAVREHCQGDYLFLLNNDVFLKKGSLEMLAAWAQFDWVGTVGILLRHAHGTVQHAGIRAFFGGSARMAKIGNDYSDDLTSRVNKEVFGNTFAACMVKRSTFLEIGGLRPLDLPNGYGDVAFNFECLRKGLRNLYIAEVEGVHLESASRGASYEYWEEFSVEREYADILQRMLREDLGYERVPGFDLSVKVFAKEWLLTNLREKAPWLKPIKTRVKQLLQGEQRYAPIQRET